MAERSCYLTQVNAMEWLLIRGISPGGVGGGCGRLFGRGRGVGGSGGWRIQVAPGRGMGALMGTSRRGPGP